MADLDSLAQPAVEQLLKADEQQLYEQLGIRAKAVAGDPSIGSSFAPTVTYDQAQMGLKEDVQEFGQRLFGRWQTEAFKLVCGHDPGDEQDRQKVVNAFGLGEVAIASTLAALLVTHLGIVPALAGVIAALVVKRFFRPGYEEFCQVWDKRLSAGG
jgi:hypothetical protein